jgi:hypothetical protein
MHLSNVGVAQGPVESFECDLEEISNKYYFSNIFQLNRLENGKCNRYRSSLKKTASNYKNQ